MTSATRIMSADRIEALNRRACEIAGIAYEDMKAQDGLYDALMQVVSEEGLAFVRYQGDIDPDDDDADEEAQCIVYRDPRGALVNLWVDGDYLGFDDQVDLDD